MNAPIQRWTSYSVSPSEVGGYVCYGDHLQVVQPLLAEIERLQALFDAEVSAWRRVSEQNDIRRRELLADIERLTAEIAAAREDAEQRNVLTDDMLRYAMAALGTGSPTDADWFRAFWLHANAARGEKAQADTLRQQPNTGNDRAA